jgi:threonine/homoserine/homoserine lactone efflux protein
LDAVYLLGLGFVVGLSGAMMPGPLLVYTIAQSLRKGWMTGFFVIVGHAIVEVALMILIYIGITALITSAFFTQVVGAVGGAVMVFMAWTLYKSGWDVSKKSDNRTHGSIVGGILFTALNPGFPLWWATAGAKLLMEGVKDAGLLGAGFVIVGHWGADFGYYMLVSTLTAKGKENIVKRYVSKIKDILATMLAFIGIYFLTDAIKACLL